MIRKVGKQLGRDEEVLAAVGLAGDVDERVVDGTFGAGVHALVDLINEGERCARELRQAHKVEDGSQGPLLHILIRSTQRNQNSRTYSSRLPLGGQQLQLLVVTELYEDIDCPLVVVVVLSDLDFARTANAVEGGRELLADVIHEFSQSGFPEFLPSRVVN